MKPTFTPETAADYLRSIAAQVAAHAAWTRARTEAGNAATRVQVCRAYGDPADLPGLERNAAAAYAAECALPCGIDPERLSYEQKETLQAAVLAAPAVAADLQAAMDAATAAPAA
jgi:hypothetical protein